MKFILAALALAGIAAATPVSKRDDDASRFTFYDMKTPLAGPCDLCNGPDGAIWGEDILSNIIFRIDPATGSVLELPIPFTGPALPLTALPLLTFSNATRGAFACAIRPGADGNLYAAAGVRNQLVRINPTTHDITVFSPPNSSILGDLEPFNDLYSGADGMFFTQTTGDVVTYFEYATGEFTNYQVPTAAAGPLGMFVAHDGIAYFAELFADKIGALDRKTGTIKEYDLPLVKDGGLSLGPAVIRVETENRYIWFTCILGNSIGRLDPVTGDVKLFPNNLPLSLPSEDTLSPDGRVWFSTMTQNTLNYVDPDTGKVVNIVNPPTVIVAPLSLPFELQVAVNYFEGAIWFTQPLGNRVGRYQL